MADKMASAVQVYNTLCSAIDRRNWHYTRIDDKLTVHFDVHGEDIPMDFIMVVDAERQIIVLMSPMSFNMSEDKRVEGALATVAATYGMANGCFDYDLSTGRIVFRMTASFRESSIGEGLFQYMISCSCAMVDKYNDRFLAINKGTLSITDFIGEEYR